MLVLGIDEAGRGPVIGPLVICGYMIEDEKISALKKLNIKDSKELTKNQRLSFYKKLVDFAVDIKFSITHASRIDMLRKVSNLNKYELEEISKIINIMKPDIVIVDAFEKNIELFSSKLRSKLKIDVELICEHYADTKHIPVSAASILAKVRRDNMIHALNKRFAIGSGYPSDERTIEFLKKCMNEFGYFPSFVRKSWATIKHIKKRYQKSVLDF